MKLNKLQRYTAYCILLQDAEDNKLIYNECKFGICNLFKKIFGVYPQFRDYHIFYYGNVQRCVSAFRRLVRANLVGDECPAFLTLTYVQIVSLKTAWSDFKGFILRLKRRNPRLKYVAVVEFQKRGAPHFHVLAWGIKKEIQEAERDTRYIQHQWLRGWVDLVRTDGHPAISSYMSKYMRKAMHDPRLSGQKAYTA